MYSRVSNNINISGGTFGGNVEGGAGATDNIIKITGGTFSPSTQGNSGGDALGSASNAIYAGVSDASTLNKSTNGTVILQNLNDRNSFLSTFTEGNNGVSGIIFGSNVTGTSDLKSEKVNGTYNGGFKDFNNVNIDAASNVKLNGNSYYADDWPVDGTLDTQQKILHAYHQKLQYLKM